MQAQELGELVQVLQMCLGVAGGVSGTAGTDEAVLLPR